jgi:DNA-binding beta-propeller fold protein YncE
MDHSRRRLARHGWGVSADGTKFWALGPYDSVVYVFDTATGTLLTKITVNPGPHGLAVWPQPGRYCPGHTSDTR